MPSRGNLSRKTSKTWCAAKLCAIRTQGAIEQRSVLLPFLRRPIVGGRLDRANRLDRGVEIAGFVPEKFQPISRLGGFRVDVDDGNVPSPVLIIDLDRIVTHGDDQIRPVRESLHVGAPRAADNAGPVSVIFRQKTFRVHRLDKRQSLPFDELEQFSRRSAAREAQPRDQQGTARARQRAA